MLRPGFTLALDELQAAVALANALLDVTPEPREIEVRPVSIASSVVCALTTLR